MSEKKIPEEAIELGLDDLEKVVGGLEQYPFDVESLFIKQAPAGKTVAGSGVEPEISAIYHRGE